METTAEILQFVSLAAFVALGFMASRLRRERRDEGSRWVFLTFAVLAVVSVAGLVLPDNSDALWAEIATRILIAVLLLFPYFLYRLGATFASPSKLWDRLAAGLTALVIAWGFVMPNFPDEGEPRSTAVEAYVLAILVQWVLLSGVVSVRFWRGGKGQPGVIRQRVRMLSLASAALSVAIIVSGAAPSDHAAGIDVVIQLVALASALAFYFAFSPPDWLRAGWRKPQTEELRVAILHLMGAETREEAMEGLLPHAVSIVGGEGVAVVAEDGTIVGSYGIGAEGIRRLQEELKAPLSDPGEAPFVRLEFPFGEMIVTTSPLTPFFGKDEIDVLGSLGALANLALERVKANELRVELAAAALRRQQALEINDNVVQGLIVAKYSFDMERIEDARVAVERSLEAARGIVADLLGELSGGQPFAPGAFVRGNATPEFLADRNAPAPAPEPSEAPGPTP